MPLFGQYNPSPDGNDDFIPGSVISSSEHDGNYARLGSYLNTQFVDDATTAVGALNGDRLTDNSVTALQLSRKSDPGLAAVQTDNIATDAVTDVELADDAVDTAAIQDLAVVDAKIADLDGTKLLPGTVPSSSFDASVQFPITVTGETIQFPSLGSTVPLASSNVNPAGISVYPAGMPGSPYTEGVHWNFIAPNQIQQIDNGPAPGDIPILTNVEVDYNGSTYIPPNSIGDTELIDGEILNSKINVAAGIELSKLDDFIGGVRAVTPTGGALTGTLGVAGIAVDAITATQIAPNAVGASEIAIGAVGQSEIAGGSVDYARQAQLPAGFMVRVGSGNPHPSPGNWSQYPFAAVVQGIWNTQAGVAHYANAGQYVGFQVTYAGTYLLTVSGDFLRNAQLNAATYTGIRIRRINNDVRVVAKDVSAWAGSPIEASNGCSIALPCAFGDVFVAEFISDQAIRPDAGGSMSVSWVSP